MMKELLKHLVTEIVSQPKKVKIEEVAEEGGITRLTFSVAPEDMGIVIGKNGRTITAIRSLVKTAAAKAGKNVFLELKE